MTTGEGTPGTHACRVCGKPIADLYSFRVCVRCSLDALARDPDLLKWREEKRRAAYERLNAAGLLKDDET